MPRMELGAGRWYDILIHKTVMDIAFLMYAFVEHIKNRKTWKWKFSYNCDGVMGI